MEDIISEINRELHQRTRAVHSVERQQLRLVFSPEGFKKFKDHPGVCAVEKTEADKLTVFAMKVYVEPDQREDFVIKRG